MKKSRPLNSDPPNSTPKDYTPKDFGYPRLNEKSLFSYIRKDRIGSKPPIASLTLGGRFIYTVFFIQQRNQYTIYSMFLFVQLSLRGYHVL